MEKSTKPSVPLCLRERSLASISHDDERGKRALCAELGVAKTLRFLQGYSQGSGNYTEERAATFEGEALPEILDEIKANRK